MEEQKLQIALENWQKLQPLSEEDRTRLRRRFTVDFNYNSNHLEGNTLTYGQTEILLLFGKVIGEAELKDIRPFHKYMNSLMTEEIENDVLFVTEKSNNVWWYDGQRIVFRTQTYDKILRTLQRDNRATLAILQQEVGVNRSALQKMLARLQEKRYVERDDKGGWRVFITPSV